METKTTEVVTVEQFRKMLQRHDWFYMYADQMASYNAGESNEKSLRALCAQNTEFAREYREYKAYVFRRHDVACDWRLCPRPSWLGEDEGLATWLLLEDPALVETLRRIDAFVQLMDEQTKGWKVLAPHWVLKRPMNAQEPLLAITAPLASAFVKFRLDAEAVLKIAPTSGQLYSLFDIARWKFAIRFGFGIEDTSPPRLTVGRSFNKFLILYNYGK